ncbi:MAG: PilZ domain-containing protein [Candidatus Omnitrophica bacterium]|nr:PilZ domain-containing protein [Candidatus Omnitrophota bacterium]
MVKIKNVLAERRRYIRLQTPITISFAVPETGKVYTTSVKNISADGLRFETRDKHLKESSEIEFKLDISAATNPVHAKGRVVWKKKLSLEDAAPFDVGIEFIEIENDNKNTFLKFLCDLIYNIVKEKKHPNE